MKTKYTLGIIGGALAHVGMALIVVCAALSVLYGLLALAEGLHPFGLIFVFGAFGFILLVIGSIIEWCTSK